MKTLLFFLSCFFMIQVQAQTQDYLKIGSVQGGQLTITNKTLLLKYFNQSLGFSGALSSDIKTDAAPNGDRFLVYTSVVGNARNITNIGIVLINVNGEARIVRGNPDLGVGGSGSAEYKCIGNPCNDCELKISWVPSGFPNAYCNCKQAGSNNKCNMEVTYKININLGF